MSFKLLQEPFVIHGNIEFPYDDQITRELIEKITVVDGQLIRIKFVEEADEMDQTIG